MITFIQCVKGRPELSIPEFREHWQAYGKKAQAVARASGAVGVYMNTTLAVEENLEVQLRRGTAEPFDGVLKVCWPNAAGLDEVLGEPRVSALLDDFQSYQERFIDLDRSSFFFASEEALHQGTT